MAEKPIHCLVFSKDRAMQLDAFLRSASEHSPYASITVLWEASNDQHHEAYALVGKAYALVGEWRPRWLTETIGGFDANVIFFTQEYERVVFHTDDEVFYRTPPADMLSMLDDVIPTFRQGRNTTWCQVLDRPQAIPDSFPLWRWKDAELDFAYPLSLNACVYQSADILPLLDFSFSNPTQLEAGLACNAARLRPQWMVAPEHSCTVALPHNVVSVDSGCPRGGNPEWQPDALCEKYLDGWRIDLGAMDFTDIVAAHQEVPLKFKRKDAR